VFPILRPPEEEVLANAPGRKTIAEAVRLFRNHGCLQLDGVFRPALVRRLHKAYVARYREYFVEKDHADALRVGPRRYMITVHIEPPFHSPALYANPFVFPILEEALGESLVLNSFGSVVSLPDDPEQELHRDHPQLFDDTVADYFIPPVAVTMIVPLVDLNQTNGTTRMIEGSHKVPAQSALARPAYDPTVSPGSCLLMDYRLVHGGTPNHSRDVRPIFYMVYSRPWFRDIVNFGRQEPIVMSREEYQRTPLKWRRLFALAKVTA
jgi:hypothetical protein